MYGRFSDNFNFCYIICLYFKISNFKIYPVYTSLFMYNFLIWKPTTHNVEYLIHFYAFLRQFNNKMSLPSHTCIYLQKINW